MATERSAWNFVCGFLFKAWKWAVHLLSGTCEIERICKYPHLVTRTVFISELQCLSLSIRELVAICSK